MSKRINDGKARTSVPASPEPTAAPAPRVPTRLPVDEFHGQGGSYVMEGGLRRRAVQADTASDTATATKDTTKD